MNCTNNIETQVFDVVFNSTVHTLLRIQAKNPEEACQLASECFGLDNGFHNRMMLERMHAVRHILGAVSPDNYANQMECGIECEINVLNEGNDNASLSRSTFFILQEGDAFDPFSSPLPDEVCLMYLLDKTPALIPFDQLDRYTDRLGHDWETADIPGTDLQMYYNPEAVLTVGDDRYLIGPAVVYAVEDKEPEPMTDAELVKARQLLTERTVTLCADGEDFYGLKLFD